MIMKRHLIGATLLAACWTMPASADGMLLWSRDVPVAAASGDQGLLQPVVVTDESDGAFVIWHDRHRSNVYVLRLAGDGSAIWPARQVATTVTEKLFPSAVASGDGDVIVAWAESRSGGGCGFGGQLDCDIYAQKFDRDGQRLWTNGGRPVVRAAANQGVSGIALASDGQGGAFVAWEDARPDCCKVFAQHLGADGLRVWATNGVRISPNPFIVFGPMHAAPIAVSDGEGGVLVAWIENQVNPVTERAPLVVQRLDADGNALWIAGGIKVGKPTHSNFSMAPDVGGGALIGFTMDGVNGFADAAVQRVASDGTLPWGAQGVRAAVAGYYHSATEVVSDGRGGALVAFVDNTFVRFSQDDADIRAQHVRANGQLAWARSGRIVSDLPGAQDIPRIVSDGNEGALLFWRDCRDYLDFDACQFSANLYGQHLRRNGTAVWAIQGEPVSKAAGSQSVALGSVGGSSIAAMPDGAGGAVLAWPDGRVGGCVYTVFTTECDVRAQRVADNPDPTVADLSLSLEVTRAAGTGYVTFRMMVTNMGPGISEAVKVFLPDLQHAILNGAPTNGAIIGDSLIFSLGNVANGRQRTASFTVSPFETSEVCATGRVYSETLDSTYDNNGGTICIAVP